MHADDQDVLVVGTIEDRDIAPLRRVRVNAPKKIMLPFFDGRLLEPPHLHALRIHGADDMPAGAVLAGAVDALQHDQKTMPMIGVKRALQLADAVQMLLQVVLRVRFIFVIAVESGVDRGEVHRRAGLDSEALFQIHVPILPTTYRKLLLRA